MQVTALHKKISQNASKTLHSNGNRHHPGDPYFHDAYKGWSCCQVSKDNMQDQNSHLFHLLQNKSTDFTTFLNTPGCALGKHSNVKPINPEKITGNLNKEPEPVVVETRPPIQPEGEIRKCNLNLR